MLLGGAGAQLLLSSLFSLSLQSPIVCLFPINTCLSLPLSASDDVSQSGFENLGKLMFCFLHCISIIKIQVIVLVLLPVLAMMIRQLSHCYFFVTVIQIMKILILYKIIECDLSNETEFCIDN